MEKIKQFLGSERGRHMAFIAIIILVGLGSFELGRLTKEENSGGIRIEYPEGLEANVFSSIEENIVEPDKKGGQAPTKKGFFASIRGRKYYPANCSAGKNIKQENRVWFDSRGEAEAAGYELSSSCR